MSSILAYIIQIIVLASNPDTLLTVDYSAVTVLYHVRVDGTLKDVLELQRTADDL